LAVSRSAWLHRIRRSSRRYGLSNETLAHWVRDEAKSLAIGLLLAAAARTVIYFLIRLSPDWWWMSAGALFHADHRWPERISRRFFCCRLFYTVKPLDRDNAAPAASRARRARRCAGFRRVRVGLAEKTKKATRRLRASAGTRRILVSETMLAEYSYAPKTRAPARSASGEKPQAQRVSIERLYRVEQRQQKNRARDSSGQR